MYWQPYQLKPKRVELNTYAKLDMSVAHSRNGFIPLLHLPLPVPHLHSLLLRFLPLLPNLHPNLLLPVLPQVQLLRSSSSFLSLFALLPFQPFFWYLMDFFLEKVKNRICLIQVFQITKAFWIQPNLIDREWFEGHTGPPAFHSCRGILNILRCSLRAWRARHLGRRSLAFMMGDVSCLDHIILIIPNLVDVLHGLFRESGIFHPYNCFWWNGLGGWAVSYTKICFDILCPTIPTRSKRPKISTRWFIPSFYDL